jgi:hypothetical protein
MWQFNDEFLNKDFPRYFRQIAAARWAISCRSAKIAGSQAS